MYGIQIFRVRRRAYTSLCRNFQVFCEMFASTRGDVYKFYVVATQDANGLLTDFGMIPVPHV